jgi:hypothetical protein
MAGKGNAKTGGRKKGIPNKETICVQDVCRRFGYDPLEAQIHIAKDPATHPSLKVKINIDLMQYIYPKVKGDEFTPEETRNIMQMMLVTKLNAANSGS